MPEAAAEVGTDDRMTFGAQVGDERADGLEGLLQRPQLRELAADVDGHADGVQARERGGERIGRARPAERHAELVFGLAGRGSWRGCRRRRRG